MNNEKLDNEDDLVIAGIVEFLKMIQQERNPRRPLEETEFIYCLVGNVVPYHYHGVEKKIVRGTRQLSGNTKLYIFPRIGNYSPQNVRVIGLSRITKKYKLMYFPVRLITNWRLQKVYKKHVIEKMFHNDGWRDTEMDRNSILAMILWLNELTEKELPFKD